MSQTQLQVNNLRTLVAQNGALIKLIEDGIEKIKQFLGISTPTGYEFITPYEIIAECKVRFADEFGDDLPDGFEMPNSVEVDGQTYSGTIVSLN